MSKGIWILGAAVTIVGVGFVYAVNHGSQVAQQVAELDKKIRDQESRAAKAAQGLALLPQIAEDVKRIQEQLGQIRDRMDAPGRRPAAAAGSAADAPGSASTAETSVARETVDLVLNEQKALKQQQKAAKKAAKAAQRPAQHLASFAKTLQLNDAQAATLKPLFEEYDKQLTVLADKRKHTPKADRAPVDEEIAQLKKSTHESIVPYLTDAGQAAKSDHYFNAPRHGGGNHAGQGSSPAQTPAPIPVR